MSGAPSYAIVRSVRTSAYEVGGDASVPGTPYHRRADPPQAPSPTPGEPEDADCKQIRAEAEERCEKELAGKQFGRDYKYRDIEHCMDSEVEERCGGHHYERYSPRPPRRPRLSA